jgi:bifunctional UDP-N-acetylglucosamine pyrophosphorylase/glucosamine-1-phosphate N-acetyltransferase
MTSPTERPRVAVVLAAGKGTRLRSELPKVLHEAGGRPLLSWVIDAARRANCTRILVVIGHGADAVRKAFPDDDLTWVVQHEQLGTGHALAQVAPSLPPGEQLLLVLSGDVPLLLPATLERLAAAAAGDWGAMAVAELSDPGRLGRVVARPPGDLLATIVEAADARAEELAIRVINAGIYALPAPAIFTDLAALTTANAQGEYYLTEALNRAAQRGERVRLVPLEDPAEGLGVNSRAELAGVHRRLLDRHGAALMRAGVTLLEPARTAIEPSVAVGADTVIHADVCLLGATTIGSGCTLHQGAWLRDTMIGDGVVIEPYSVLDRARVDTGCRVGPFARLRPASHLCRGARVGNFVEVKASRLGEDSRVGHLTYLGDADIGARANIGAGTITCNFDGTEKHRTEIGRDAFIGSDTQLVAPVKIGDGASTAAGSVITRDVPAEALAVARERQRNLPGRAAGLPRRRRRPPDDTPQ